MEGISGDHLGKLPTPSKTLTGITAVVGGTSSVSFSFCACGTGDPTLGKRNTCLAKHLEINRQQALPQLEGRTRLLKAAGGQG